MRWIEPGKPALVLAPMEGVIDAPMRELVSRHGAFSYCVSEFVRVSQEIPPPKVFLRHIPELANLGPSGPQTPSGLPIQVQLLGGDPERMALAAIAAVELGAKAIDINFGCPAPTVNRHDGGATLLKYPDRIRAIVRAIREALPREIPVSAKLRLGWEDMDSIFVNAERAAEGGASWITIHGRTRMQAYQPPADWTRIGKVRELLGPSVPVVANGDLWTLEDFRRCREITGAEHYMMGRGALANLPLSRHVARELGMDFSRECRPRSLSELAREFGELSLAFASEKPFYALARLKQWLSLMHRHRAGGLPVFEVVKKSATLEEAWAIIDGKDREPISSIVSSIG